MTRRIAFLAGILAITAAALFAQAPAGQGRGPAAPPSLEPGASQADVDKAILAAPAQLRNQATVIKWNPSDWSYTYLRKGTNNIMCFDKSGLPGQLPFSVECSHPGNLDRAQQNMKFEAILDPIQRQAALDAAEKDGAVSMLGETRDEVESGIDNPPRQVATDGPDQHRPDILLSDLGHVHHAGDGKHHDKTEENLGKALKGIQDPVAKGLKIHASRNAQTRAPFRT